MSLPFAIPDTAPFIHYDPLTRWTSAYASVGDGKGDQTYHQAGVAMAGIDFNITATNLAIQTSPSPLQPASSPCGLQVSINSSTPTSTCSISDLPDGVHRISIKAEREGTRVLGISGDVATRSGKGMAEDRPRRVVDNKSPEWKFQGSWTSLDESSGSGLDVKKYGDLKRYEGGSGSVAGGTARAQLEFQGEAIWLYGFSGPYGGAGRVWMDGVEMANLNMSLPWANYRSLLYFQAGLDTKATHTLTFDALGRGEVVLDYAVIMGSSDENGLQSNLAALLGGILGALALILLLALSIYIYLLRRGRRQREAQGWTRIPGSSFFGARYLPPGQASSVEQWRKTSLKGEGFGYGDMSSDSHEMYDAERYGDKASMLSRERGRGPGMSMGSGEISSPSRSMSSRMRALPHTASSVDHSFSAAPSSLLSPPVAYRSPGMSAAGIIGLSSNNGSSSPLHVNRPPASPGYLPYTGPIQTSPYSTVDAAYTDGNSRSRLHGVVGGSAAAREWLQRSTSRRSKASTTASGSVSGLSSRAHSRAGTLRGAGLVGVGQGSRSGSAKSDISSVLGTGRTRSSGHSINTPSLRSPQAAGSAAGFSRERVLVGLSEPEEAYHQPGRHYRHSPNGSGREELQDEHERYADDKHQKMADWARSVSPRAPSSVGMGGNMRNSDRARDERGRGMRGSEGAPLSSVSGFSSELGEPFTAMIGTMSTNPLSMSTRSPVGRDGGVAEGKRGSEQDIITKFWPITAASPHPQRGTIQSITSSASISGLDDARVKRTADRSDRDAARDEVSKIRTPPRLPLSVSSRTMSVAGAAPSSRVLPVTGGTTPMTGGASHTPISAPGREIALTPATGLTPARLSSNNDDDDLDFDETGGVAGEEDGRPNSAGQAGRRGLSIRSMRSVKSSKTDRSYLSFLRGPGDDPWNAMPGGLPAMPQTAARPDSVTFQAYHPYGRQKSVDEPSRADLGINMAGDERMSEGEEMAGVKGAKVKKLPPPPLGLHGAAETAATGGGGGEEVRRHESGSSDRARARASVPTSEDGMRNWVIELDPNSPTTTVGRTVSRPHSYVRGW